MTDPMTPLDQLEEARETDMCVCGDRRDQHEGGSGPCLLDDGHSHGPWGHFGAGACKKFTPAPSGLTKEKRAKMGGGK